MGSSRPRGNVGLTQFQLVESSNPTPKLIGMPQDSMNQKTQTVIQVRANQLSQMGAE